MLRPNPKLVNDNEFLSEAVGVALEQRLGELAKNN